MLITVRELEAMIQDEVLDLLLLIMADKFKDAAKNGLKARLQLLTEVDAATGQVCTACQFILDDKLLANEIRQTIFAQIPRESLAQADLLCAASFVSSLAAARYFCHAQFTVAGSAAAITVWRSVAEGATTGVCGVGKIY
ncbi:MAG: hypothetical protein IPJ94_10435 [Chloroflexi bacterium]|nr:hypothetical protein [Chloroflexota bacterium]